jgi:hypothetical protein
MHNRSKGIICFVLMSLLLSFPFLHAYAAEVKPADQLVKVLSTMLLPANVDYSYNDWRDLEKSKTITWAPLPPQMHSTVLADGSYFSRRGTAVVGGRKLDVLATGARTMVVNFHFRNDAEPFGEDAVRDAFKRQGFTLELVRCPSKQSPAASMAWHKLSGPKKRTAFLQTRKMCGKKACEGFDLLLGEQLPEMTPRERALYTEQCSDAAPAGDPAENLSPDEQVAALISALTSAGVSGVPYDWARLDKVPTIKWAPLMPSPFAAGDPSADPYLREGSARLAGRQMSFTATGTKDKVKSVKLEDMGEHARGDVLGALKRLKLGVALARCGKVYTQETINWYKLTGQGRPAVLQQSIRKHGSRVQESYTLNLENRLPPIAPGETNAGVGNCR